MERRFPALAEGIRRHADHSLAEVTVTFRAADVPAVGYRAYRASAEPGGARAGGLGRRARHVDRERQVPGEADPARGGTLGAITDRRTGRNLLRGAATKWSWRRNTRPIRTGARARGTCRRWARAGARRRPARVRAERCPVGSRLITEFVLGGLTVTQETLLWDGEQRVEFRTHVDGDAGQDRLLRVRFPADVPGGLPVYQTATAVIGRPFGHPDVDAAEHWFTLDNPAHDWFGVGSTARVALTGPDGTRLTPIGVAEVISSAAAAAGRDAIRGLIAALAAAGVTATCSRSDGPRYGSMDADSNLPDCGSRSAAPRTTP